MDLSERKSIRLKGYDYSQNGWYFVTICTKDRLKLFGNIRATTRVARTEIVGAGLVPARKNEERRPPGSPVQVPTLGEIVGAFKSITTTEYIEKMEENGWPRFRGRLWHRNYYEHIIRSEKEYCLIRRYIRNNPINWKKDKENID